VGSLVLGGSCSAAARRTPPEQVFWSLPGAVTDLRRLSDGSGTLVATVDRDAGIFVSRDGGETWRAGIGLGNLAGYTLTELDGGRILLAGTSLGVARSEDGGWGWSLAWAAQPGAFAFLIGGDGRPVAAVHQGLAIGDRAGRRWDLAPGQVAGATLLALAPLADYPGRLVAGTNAAGILLTPDRGRTWQPVYPTRAVVSRLARQADGSLLGLAEQTMLRWPVQPGTPSSPPSPGGPESLPQIGEPEVLTFPGAEGRPLSLALSGDRAFIGTSRGELFAGDHSFTLIDRLPSAISALWASPAELCLGTVDGQTSCRPLPVRETSG
jgi:hypothetical protein